MSSWLAKWFIKIWGWKQEGFFPPQEVKKYVLIAAPHTSWQDFFIGIFSKLANQAPIYFLGKASLFKFPLGVVLKWFGGLPVNRLAASNKVDAIAKMFNDKEHFAICIAPEGTRKKVDHFRTGFYYIAKKANVPIVMCSLDYKHKIIGFSQPYYLGNDQEKDFEYIWNHFKGVNGKNPSLSIN